MFFIFLNSSVSINESRVLNGLKHFWSTANKSIIFTLLLLHTIGFFKMAILIAGLITSIPSV